MTPRALRNTVLGIILVVPLMAIADILLPEAGDAFRVGRAMITGTAVVLFLAMLAGLFDDPPPILAPVDGLFQIGDRTIRASDCAYAPMPGPDGRCLVSHDGDDIGTVDTAIAAAQDPVCGLRSGDRIRCGTATGSFVGWDGRSTIAVRIDGSPGEIRADRTSIRPA